MLYQLSRLRLSKNVPDAEMEAITRAISESLKSYEHVVEVSQVLRLSVIIHDHSDPASRPHVTSRWRTFISKFGVIPPARIHSRSHRRHSERTSWSPSESSSEAPFCNVSHCHQGRSDVPPGSKPLLTVCICPASRTRETRGAKEQLAHPPQLQHLQPPVFPGRDETSLSAVS